MCFSDKSPALISDVTKLLETYNILAKQFYERDPMRNSARILTVYTLTLYVDFLVCNHLEDEDEMSFISEYLLPLIPAGVFARLLLTTSDQLACLHSLELYLSSRQANANYTGKTVFDLAHKDNYADNFFVHYSSSTFPAARTIQHQVKAIRAQDKAAVAAKRVPLFFPHSCAQYIVQ